MKAIPEFHQQGNITVENLRMIFSDTNFNPEDGFGTIKGDLGVQVAEDGRVWICIDGIAFIRFSPHPNGKMKPPFAEAET